MLFLAIAVIVCGKWFFDSPLPGAIADSLSEGRDGSGRADVAEAIFALTEQVAALREEVAEVGERLEFTERMLARSRQVGALPTEREG